jgi:GTPase SAR1 family protein
MGSTKSKLPEKNIIMTGLDSAGMSSILRKLDLENLMVTIPSIGAQLKYLEIKRYDLSITSNYICWHEELHFSFRCLPFEKADALVFVIDSHDVTRIDERFREKRRTSSAKEVLYHLISGKLDLIPSNIPILLIANKIDLEGCLSIDSLIERLDVMQITSRKWSFIATSAVTGVGIEQIMPWILNSLNYK